MQRRKKTSEEASAEPKQVPLQPAYFDAEQSEKPAVEVESASGESSESSKKLDRAAAVHDEDDAEDVNFNRIDAVEPVLALAASAVSPGERRPQRRRRGRGGRGKGPKERGPEQSLTSPVIPAESREVEKPKPAPTPAKESGSAVTASAQAPRPPKGTVVLAIGLPGSGKSSWFKRHNLSPLSSDMLRAILFDDPTEQRFQDLVFSNLRSMLKARLIARRPLNYVDATNLTAHDRASWIKLAKDYGYEVQAVYFDVPLEVCLQRNAKRERAVPEDVMRRMAGKLTAPAFEEGFSKITMVRVKSKE